MARTTNLVCDRCGLKQQAADDGFVYDAAGRPKLPNIDRCDFKKQQDGECRVFDLCDACYRSVVGFIDTTVAP